MYEAPSRCHTGKLSLKNTPARSRTLRRAMAEKARTRHGSWLSGYFTRALSGRYPCFQPTLVLVGSEGSRIRFLRLPRRLSVREQEERTAHRISMIRDIGGRRFNRLAVFSNKRECKNRFPISPRGRELRNCATSAADFVAGFFISANLRKVHLWSDLRTSIEPVYKHFPGTTARLFVEKGDPLEFGSHPRSFQLVTLPSYRSLIWDLVNVWTPLSQTSFETIKATASSPMWISLK